MAVERPTFSESWYRVAGQRPRLRSTVQSYRQHYRGQLWHVLRDPSNNQFFRLNDAAYHFIGLLDGRRTVEEVWNACNEDLGDQAPTQNEAIQLLGQIYTSNLLRGEMPSDAEGMFERYRKRVGREVRGYMMNLLFIRIPLFDPDHLLNRWVKVFGWMFSWVGFALWCLLVGYGLSRVIGHADELMLQVNHVLAPENLVFLYLSFAGIKAIHEFGHGFACKKYGLRNGSGGEVHTMGIMFLVFMPVPYVDASSAWALRSKWQRIVISAGGMYVELAVAAVAAVVWAETHEGNPIHTIAYNLMFIASVSSLLFNGNPLLRFDGYYILSDLLEIPNLSQRGKDYIYFLVRRYVYGVTRARTTAHRAGEKRWLTVYGITSAVYRVFISVRILMFVADKLFFVGAAMAILAIVTWVLTPLGKWIKYLATSPELMRVRPRAVVTTAAFFATVFLVFGAIPVPDHVRAAGFVEADKLANIYASTPGFVSDYLASGERVTTAGPGEGCGDDDGATPLCGVVAKACDDGSDIACVCDRTLRDMLADSDEGAGDGGVALVSTQNHELRTQLFSRCVSHAVLLRRLSIAETGEYAEVQVIQKELAAAEKAIVEIGQRVDRLHMRPPIHGVWVSSDIERMRGVYVQPGDLLGRVVQKEKPVILVLADQRAGPQILRVLEHVEASSIEMRVQGQANAVITGRLRLCAESGLIELPPEMQYSYGVPLDPTDSEGRRTLEHFFPCWIEPDPQDAVTLLPGRRVEARIHVGSRPLVFQWWQAIRQLVQKRFNI